MVKVVVTLQNHEIKTFYTQNMKSLMTSIQGMDILELHAKAIPVKEMRQGR